jgi:hypothetical protein
MSNLKAFSSNSSYQEVIVVFENDFSQIVKCEPLQDIALPQTLEFDR